MRANIHRAAALAAAAGAARRDGRPAHSSGPVSRTKPTSVPLPIRSAVRSRDRCARAMGVRGAPFFVVDERYVLSGAQEREVFRQVFAAARAAAE